MTRIRQIWICLAIIAGALIPSLFGGPVGARLDNSGMPAFQSQFYAPGDPVVDNSTSSAFPPIGDQGGLSSCVGWATTYYQFTYENAVVRGFNAAGGNPNFIFSPKWTFNMINHGVNGDTSLDDAYLLLSKNGAATLAEFPYDEDYRAWCLQPDAWRNAINFRASATAVIIDSGTDAFINNIKNLLAEGHVLVYTTYIQEWVQRQIEDDPSIPDDDALAGQYIAGYMTSGEKDLHSMTLVGYNDYIWCDLNNNAVVDPGEKGAFKAANSRGIGDWNSGFRWISYDALRAASAVPAAGNWPTSDRDTRGILLGKAYSLTARASYTPTLLAEVTLNAPFRDQIISSLGIGSAGSSAPSITWQSAALNLSGGPYAFDGTSTPVDGTFYFDYTDLAPQIVAGSRWFVGIDNTGHNTVTIKSFRLYHNGVVSSSSETPLNIDGHPTYLGLDYPQEPPTPPPPPASPPITQPPTTYNTIPPPVLIPPATPEPKIITLSGFEPVNSLLVNSQGMVQQSIKLNTLDKLATLGISQGTLLQDSDGDALTHLSVEIPEDLPLIPPGTALISCYEFKPGRATIDPPSKLTVRYDPSKLPAQNNETGLYLASWDGKKWIELTSFINLVGKTVSSDIGHFSQYALLEKIPPQPPQFSFSFPTVSRTSGTSGTLFTFNTTVSNTGGLKGMYHVVLKINGIMEDQEYLYLDAGKTQNVSFEVTRVEPGDYFWDINGTTGRFTIPQSESAVAAVSILTPEPEIMFSPLSTPLSEEPTILFSTQPVAAVDADATGLTLPVIWVIAGSVAVAVILIWVIVNSVTQARKKEIR